MLKQIFQRGKIGYGWVGRSKNGPKNQISIMDGPLVFIVKFQTSFGEELILWLEDNTFTIFCWRDKFNKPPTFSFLPTLFYNLGFVSYVLEQMSYQLYEPDIFSGRRNLLKLNYFSPKISIHLNF